MSGAQRPQPGDVVIHQRSPKTYTTSAMAGTPQVPCGTLEEALERARSFAGHARVAIWLTTDERDFKMLADI